MKNNMKTQKWYISNIYQRYIILVLLFALSSFSATAKDKITVCALEYPSLSNVVKTLVPTVVNISTTQLVDDQRDSLEGLLSQLPKNSPFEHFFRDYFGNQMPGGNERQAVTSLGSGFVISEDGYIITNNHVVDGADSIDVKFNDGVVSRAKIIGKDRKSDIALLKVNTSNKLPFVTFGDSDSIEVGDWVIAIGNPFGLGGSVTSGIISARGRNISDGSNTNFFQTDAAINRGNSGGPMFNTKGDLIGINTAIFSNSGGNIGIGFAIPSKTALPIINQLKEKGSVVRGWLGVNVQFITPAMAEALGLDNAKGAYVVGIAEGSPAEKSGMQIDDIIIEFNGYDIDDMYLLPRIVSNTKINKKVEIVVLRKDGKKFSRKKLTTVITKLDDNNRIEPEQNSEADNIKYKEYLGYKLSELTDNLRDKYKVSPDITGIIVVGFDENSQNRIATGLQSGDVIHKVNQITVNKLDQFIKIVEKNKKLGKKHILLSIKRGNDITVVVTLNIEH